jgi:hypothetical protein
MGFELEESCSISPGLADGLLLLSNSLYDYRCLYLRDNYCTTLLASLSLLLERISEESGSNFFWAIN